MFLNKRIANYYTFEKMPQKDDMSVFEGDASDDKQPADGSDADSKRESVSDISIHLKEDKDEN